VEQYSQGIHHIPYDEWDYQPTQSVVVEYEGEYVVVNEKGPGHAAMLIPFRAMGIDFLFAPLMTAFAVFSTYMLGKRFANWRVGFIAGLLVLTNVTVLVMWYRSYWTDASTMHLLVLSIWLLVESNYWYNGKSMDPRNENSVTRRQRLLAVGLGILSGLAFGASVSTRYATALVLIAMVVYIMAFYLLRAWPDLRKGRFKIAIRRSIGRWAILGAFMLGLLCILIPLMQYNSTYFGGPFGAGYDQTLVNHFSPSQGLTDRTTSESWSSDMGSMLSNTFGNFIALLPVFIVRMPALIFLPLGIWLFRKKPVLLLLLLWLIINFFSYLAIGWVDMYANLPPDILHEPRYFMPSIPAIALLGGIAIDRFAPWVVRSLGKGAVTSKESAKTGTVALTVLIVWSLALWGLVPAASYFANQDTGGALSPGGPRINAVPVTTDQLIQDPQAYRNKLVTVKNANVLSIDKDLLEIQSESSTEPGGIPALWRPGEAPQVQIGDRIDVTGIFTDEPLPIITQGYFIKVVPDKNPGPPP
jgi:hypothetical protein